MSRMYQLKGHEKDSDYLIVIDLDKVCMARIDSHPERHYPSLHIRSVDGHEAVDILPAKVANDFLEAYRAFLDGEAAS
jgi:hypothetical protein